jgi:hypothetical protein
MVQLTMVSDWNQYETGQTYWFLYAHAVGLLNNGVATIYTAP